MLTFTAFLPSFMLLVSGSVDFHEGTVYIKSSPGIPAGLTSYLAALSEKSFPLNLTYLSGIAFCRLYVRLLIKPKRLGCEVYRACFSGVF